MYIFLSFRNVIETFGESRFGEHKYSSWSWFRHAVLGALSLWCCPRYRVSPSLRCCPLKKFTFPKPVYLRPIISLRKSSIVDISLWIFSFKTQNQNFLGFLFSETRREYKTWSSESNSSLVRPCFKSKTNLCLKDILGPKHFFCSKNVWIK